MRECSIIFLTFEQIFNIFYLMAKSKKEKTRFICQSCGFNSPRWIGRCTECGEWNSMIEEKVVPEKRSRSMIPKTSNAPVALSEVRAEKNERIVTRSDEFNRVLGGGIVPGSVVLVGGDPGIGKSTLMLQEGARIASLKMSVLYISGEELTSQIKMRADRLGINSENLLIMAETNLEEILGQIDRIAPDIMIIDSIQTVYRSDMDSAPGSISQIRECAYQFISVAKERNIPVFLIGHVTKEGYIAGPKVLEHMVDTLLFFEGDKDHFYRILRAVKNRFGSTNEIGVFEMMEKGLMEVNNPSEMFLSERNENIPGSSVICALEGTRPVMLEIQALVTPSNYGLPQRSATGIDSKRLAMLLAVLEKRIGLRIGTHDVFVNAVGGIRIDEPSADLGIALAIASSLKNVAIDPKTVVIGEIGLGGELRAVSQIEKRISESGKLGFKRIVIPVSNRKAGRSEGDLVIEKASKLDDAIQLLLD
ncbi:MAG: DNA repair protein RadA [candidate division KSB1 bacterium]|jgi:DNA repair protein RadA/Sms|nr:DNA repair protein RadA [candidate division KSB1 bacterium]